MLDCKYPLGSDSPLPSRLLLIEQDKDLLLESALPLVLSASHQKREADGVSKIVTPQVVSYREGGETRAEI